MLRYPAHLHHHIISHIVNTQAHRRRARRKPVFSFDLPKGLHDLLSAATFYAGLPLYMIYMGKGLSVLGTMAAAVIASAPATSEALVMGAPHQTGVIVVDRNTIRLQIEADLSKAFGYSIDDPSYDGAHNAIMTGAGVLQEGEQAISSVEGKIASFMQGVRDWFVRAQCEQVGQDTRKRLVEFSNNTGAWLGSWDRAPAHAEQDCLVKGGLLDAKKVQAQREEEMSTPHHAIVHEI